MPTTAPHIVAILLSLALSLILTPIVRAAARYFGVVARPKRDRWHTRPTALLGGVALFAAIAGVAATMVVDSLETRVVLGCSALLFGVGLVDDFLRLKPYQKLIGQLMGVMPVLYCGLTLPWTGSSLIDTAITVLWLVGITNAVNLLDNMDGLAAGVALIAACFLGLNFAAGGASTEALMMVVFAAGLLGFLVYNSHPASIFMGDCGSLFIGFYLAASALLNPMVVGRSRSLLPVLAVPVLILFIPIFDTLLVIMLRKLAGRAASQGGRDHTSHRLVALGLSERKAVWMLYGFATVSGLLALWVRDKELDVSLALIIAFTLSLTFLGIHLGGVKVYTAEEVRAAAEKPLVSFLIDVSYKRRVFEVLLDVVLIALSYYTAYVLVFGPIEGHLERAWFFQTIPVLVSVKIAVFLASGVYRGLWRYVSLDSLVTFTKAVALSSLASILAIVFCFRFEGYSRAVFALDGLILLFLLSGSRMAFRVFRQLLPTSAPAGGRRVLIYGAGDAGELLLREIRNNPARSCTPIGFIDDDRRKTGRVIHGLRVLGASHAFRMILSAYRIEEVLISTHHLTDERVAELAVDCRNAGITLRRMRLQMECLVDPAPAGSNGHDQDDGSASGFSSWMTTALTAPRDRESAAEAEPVGTAQSA